MPKYCIIPLCKSFSNLKEGISLHTIPYFEDSRPEAQRRRQQWLDFVNNHRAHWQATKWSSVCSKHFKTDDFETMFPKIHGFESPVHPRLRKDEIGVVSYPTVFLSDDQDHYRTEISRNRKTLTEMARKCVQSPNEEMATEGEDADELLAKLEAVDLNTRRKVRIRDLNPHLTCLLCKGYFVNPVTITECIHTFCKSCLVRHISLVNKCPSCGLVIHETQPLYNIRLDRTMHDIINKLLPRIEHDERKRQKRFYRSKGMPYPSPSSKAPCASPTPIQESKPKPVKTPKNIPKPVVKPSPIGRLHHSPDQISIQLEHYSMDEAMQEYEMEVKSLPKKFIRCSTHVTVGLLQRFIATKLHLESETLIGISHNDIEMDKDFTLKYISDNLLESKDRYHPLRLQYKALELIV